MWRLSQSVTNLHVGNGHIWNAVSNVPVHKQVYSLSENLSPFVIAVRNSRWDLHRRPFLLRLKRIRARSVLKQHGVLNYVFELPVNGRPNTGLAAFGTLLAAGLCNYYLLASACHFVRMLAKSFDTVRILSCFDYLVSKCQKHNFVVGCDLKIRYCYKCSSYSISSPSLITTATVFPFRTDYLHSGEPYAIILFIE